MRWYKDEEHIGYDRDAKKIARKARQDRLDALLARNDSGKAFRTIYDEYNDEDIVLSKEELQMVQRIREGRFPHVEVGYHGSPCTFLTGYSQLRHTYHRKSVLTAYSPAPICGSYSDGTQLCYAAVCMWTVYKPLVM